MNQFKLTFIIVLALLCIMSSTLTRADSLKTTVTGLTGPALKNVQDRLNTIQQSLPDTTDRSKAESFISIAPANIRKAIEPYGYFKASIDSKLIHQHSTWTAEFFIKPGAQLPITTTDIVINGEGKNDPELVKLLQHFPLKPGQALSIEAYDNAMKTLFQTANNQGYLKTYFEKKEIRINLNNYSATIILHLNTGHRYYFGPVEFNDGPFAPAFLQRFVSFHEEQAFSSQDLLKFQQDLSSSQYFQQVLVNPEFDKTTDYRVPIQVDTVARKSQQYKFGIGYGTFTGPRFTAESEWRRVTNTGQHFNMQLKLSPVLSGLAAKYFIPGSNPLTDQYTIGANFQEFVPKNGRSFSETLSGGYVRHGKEWQYTMMLNYLRERFTINNNPWQSSNLLYPSLNISRIKSDSLIDTHEGSAASFNLQGANQNVLSQINFIQTELKGKYLTSPTEASRIIVRGDIGYTTVKDLQKLPLTLQFFTGGPNSVRGYRYDSMGPGRYLKVGSVELQHRIYGDWSGAVFYDAGIASDHFNASPQHSRGVGIVYNSVIGPIKLYVARADSTPGKPLRIDFNIGPDF